MGIYLPDNNNKRIRGKSVPRTVQRNDDASEVLVSTTNLDLLVISSTLQESRLDPQSITSSPTEMGMVGSEGQSSGLKHSKKISLLSLPADIRILIWRELAAPTGKATVYDYECHHDNKRFIRSFPGSYMSPLEFVLDWKVAFQPCILRTCKQMYEEISHIFHTDNEFYFWGEICDFNTLRFFRFKGHIEAAIPLRIRHSLNYESLKAQHMSILGCHLEEDRSNDINRRCSIKSGTERFISEGGTFALFAIEWDISSSEIFHMLGIDNQQGIYRGIYRDYVGNLHQEYLSLLREFARLLDPFVYPTVSSKRLEMGCYKRFDVTINWSQPSLFRKSENAEVFLQIFRDIHEAFRADIYVAGKLYYRDGVQMCDPIKEEIWWKYFFGDIDAESESEWEEE